jgi:iron complex transport system substrate-binding protein
MFRFIKTAVLCGAAVLSVTACGSDSKSASTTTAAAGASTSSAPSSTSPASGGPAASDTTAPADTTIASDATGSTAANADGPISVDAANGTVTLPAKPVRIVSLAPSHTETLYAIGAGAQVIAVDDQSNYPAEAASVKSDLSGYTPNVEAIAGYTPDLVLLSGDTDGVAAQLEALKIPVWVGPAATSLDDVYTEMEQLGVLTGHVADAAKLVASMQSDIASIIAQLPDTEQALTYYHELDNTYFSVTSHTFIGQIYALAGLTNIADGAEADTDYPQLNSEFIVSADPQLIFLADTKCCGETPATVAARDGWAGISAVKHGGVIAMDDDIASRWGPRVVDYLRAVVDAVNAVVAAPAG